MGYSTPKEALEDLLRNQGLRSPNKEEKAQDRIQVFEQAINGLTLAYAAEWNPYFREWSFLTAFPSEGRQLLLGICVEGIRVSKSSPGYSDVYLYAIANATGHCAPKTNVARSGLEDTPETSATLENCYRIYAKHVASEVQKLYTERSFSLTWAVEEAVYLAGALWRAAVHRRVRLSDDRALSDALLDVPLLVVERDGRREAMTPRQLGAEEDFWTVDSQLFRSIEHLLKEMPLDASLAAVADALGAAHFRLPKKVLVCSSIDSAIPYMRAVLEKSEITEIILHRDQRRVDFRWTRKGDRSRWIIPEINPAKLSSRLVDKLIGYSRMQQTRIGIALVDNMDAYLGIGGRMEDVLQVARREVVVSGVNHEIAIRTYQRTILLPGSRLAKVVLSILEDANGSADRTFILCAIVQQMLKMHFRPAADRRKTFDWLVDEFEQGARFKMSEIIDVAEVRDVLVDQNWTMFDLRAWQRGSE